MAFERTLKGFAVEKDNTYLSITLIESLTRSLKRVVVFAKQKYCFSKAFVSIAGLYYFPNNMAFSIEDLPPEVLDLIFKELNLKDIGSCSLTCTKWKDLIAALFKDKGNFFLKNTLIYKIHMLIKKVPNLNFFEINLFSSHPCGNR